MVRVVITLILLFKLSPCEAQNYSGIWISYDDYFIANNFGDDEVIGGRSMGTGYLIDFDYETISHIRKDSLVNMNIDFKKHTLSVISDSVTYSVDFKMVSKDSLEIDFKNNMIDVFKRLDLSHELNLTVEQISDFLVNNEVEKFGGILDLDFKDKTYWVDRNVDLKEKRNTLFNNSWDSTGYWYIRIIRNNFFLLINFDGMMDLKIYQILSLEKCRIKLNPISKLDFTERPYVDEIKLKKCR